MKVKELIKVLKGFNPDADVYAMEAVSGGWQLVEDAEQEFSNSVTLGCKEPEEAESNGPDKRLVDLVKVVKNNQDCVVLDVKPNSKMDLISLGFFKGDEIRFRLTKGRKQTCTVWRENGNVFSWDWGYGGYTLVSDETQQKGFMIQKCIEEDLGIKVGVLR